MKIIQKAALLLALVLLLSTAAFAAAITTTTETIGGAAAQVVYVTPSANTEIRAIIANGQLGTTAEAEAVIAREGKKIVAAINGNFYNCWYDRNKPLSVMENNYPRIYGAIVTDGKMLNSGASVALGIASDGSMKIARATIKGTLTLGRTRIVAWCVNTSNSDPQACYILTDELALGVDIPESSEIVIVRDGTVEDVQSGCANFRTPSGAVAMVLNSGCYVRGMARVGMRAEYGFCVTDGDSDMENMKNIIGGTGMIVEHGVSAVDNNPNVTADDQDPDTVSVRSFAAITADGRLMLATVTSSYRAIAQSLVQMGVQDAMTLDGGASSMLYAKRQNTLSRGPRNGKHSGRSGRCRRRCTRRKARAEQRLFLGAGRRGAGSAARHSAAVFAKQLPDRNHARRVLPSALRIPRGQKRCERGGVLPEPGH